MKSEEIVRYSKRYEYHLPCLSKKKKKKNIYIYIYIFFFCGIKSRLRSMCGVYDLAIFILFRAVRYHFSLKKRSVIHMIILLGGFKFQNPTKLSKPTFMS